MRLIFVLIAFSLVNLSYGQSYKKWSLEGALGFNNAIGPFAEGYSSNYLTLLHASLGGRYMLSNKVGLKLDVGFDRIKNDEWGNIKGPVPGTISKEFETHYFRLSLQGVFNIGRMVEFEKLDENFGLLLHFGFGFASLKDQKRSVWFKDWHTQGSDEMMNFIVGITPQYKFSEHWCLYFDASLVANAWQSKTFDFSENAFQKGLHGRLFEFGLGASYYIGSGKKHLDWVVHPEVKPQDLESNAESGSKRPDESTSSRDVVTKKKELDTDGDGVPDRIDECPGVHGRGENGCPNFDTDKDGVPDTNDDCPETVGVIENNGCPALDLYVKKVFNEAMNDVDFKYNSDVLRDGSRLILDKVVKVLNEYPEFELIQVNGHTDNTGNKEPNLILSKARAKVVMEYLISKGVAENRLEFHGLGDTKPIAPNDNPAGRRQNERIEFKVRFP